MITNFLPIESERDCGVHGCENKANWYGWAQFTGSTFKIILPELEMENLIVNTLLVFCNNHKNMYTNDKTQVW